MGWFDNLSLRYKLLVNFLFSGGILIAAIILAIVELRAADRDITVLASNSLPSVQAVGEISQLRLRYRVRSLEYMLPGSPEAKVKLAKDLEKLDGLLREAFAKYEKLISADKEREVFRAARGPVPWLRRGMRPGPRNCARPSGSRRPTCCATAPMS
ncbi:MAG: MCP four helix bundle domain-containing protein [Azovibrio sp.]|nr:MCP four helix bundle domain-containing protein [Azovibrio sp.]